VVERRWREGKEKAKQKQPRVSPDQEKEIVEILLIMDDGSRHNFKRWVSNPDALKAYIGAFTHVLRNEINSSKGTHKIIMDPASERQSRSVPVIDLRQYRKSGSASRPEAHLW
jgi:hypothetical protein